uniref:Uncharacterized protein n=1 Tax=Bacteriophage sp. TaxID=38018 RepID=A0A8D9UHQ3_9VIRU|nr:MAG TPA: hypothetical protein [Bacteriophage sp.]
MLGCECNIKNLQRKAIRRSLCRVYGDKWLRTCSNKNSDYCN